MFHYNKHTHTVHNVPTVTYKRKFLYDKWYHKQDKLYRNIEFLKVL